MIFRAHPLRTGIVASTLVAGGVGIAGAIYYILRGREEAAAIEAGEGGRTDEEVQAAVTVTLVEPSRPTATPTPSPTVTVVTPASSTPYSAADHEALAWALNSEASSQSDAERKAIAFAIRNYARRTRRPIAQIAPPGAGQGGKQPWATSKPPRDKDRSDAARFLAAPWQDDPTFGAHMFFEPAAQDKILALADLYRSDPVKYAKYANLAKYKRGSSEIRQKWTGEGNRLFSTVGRWEYYGRGDPMLARAADGGPATAVAGALFRDAVILGVDALGAA